MSILKYFKYKHKDEALPLPDPVGPLSKDVPTSSIIEANNEVLKVIADQSDSRPGLCTLLQQKDREHYSVLVYKPALHRHGFATFP